MLLQVKEYCERQWGKILAGRVSVSDFVFAKEVRLAWGVHGGQSMGPRAAWKGGGCLRR